MYQVILVRRDNGKLECAVSTPINNLYETLERVKVARKFYSQQTYDVRILRYKYGGDNG